MLVAGIWMRRRDDRVRSALAALLFFAGTLFPVLGFLNVYPFRYSFVADHYQYLASLGMIAAFSAGFAWFFRRCRSIGQVPGAAVCLALVATLPG